MAVSKQNADLLKRTPDRHSKSLVAWLMILCGLTFLLAHPCIAQDSLGAADNQSLSITFISFKPKNTIGPSLLKLHADGTLDFSIEGETLINARSAWSIQTNRFSAAVDFTIDKQAPFHYLLKFEGYRIIALYIGRASLHEYDRKERLTQKIGFFFFALPPATLERFQE